MSVAMIWNQVPQVGLAFSAKGVSAPVAIRSVNDIPDSAIPEINGEHEKDSVIAKLDEGVSLEKLNEDLKKADGIGPVIVNDDDIALDYIRLPLAEGVSVGRALVQLSDVPQIQAVQPNYIYRIPDEAGTKDNEGVRIQSASKKARVNDPYVGDCWMLDAINAYDAWDLQKTNKKVTVAVFDGQCDIKHEDLKNNVVDYYDVTDFEKDTICLAGEHATHVCGIISAEADNKIGIAGVSYNAGVLPVRVGDAEGATPAFNVVKAFKKVNDVKDKYNIKVVNISLCAPIFNRKSVSGAELGADGFALLDCIQKMYTEGILTVFASGNYAEQAGGAFIAYPGDFFGYLVGTVSLQEGEKGLERSVFSNFNLKGQRTKDISAPGTRILSLSDGYSGGDYTIKSGTSQAAPCIAGVAALVYAVNPGFSPAQVTDILYGSAKDIGKAGWDEEFGYGCVNAKKAVELAKNKQYFKGNSEVLKGKTTRLTPARSGKYTWKSDNPAVATVSGGTVKGVKPGVASIIATDEKGRTITRQMVVLDSVFSGSATLEAGETKTIKVSSKPNMEYHWTLENSDPKVAKASFVTGKDGSGNRSKIRVKGVSEGTTRITLRCGSVSRSFKITVTGEGLIKARVTGLKTKTYTGKAITQNPIVRFKGNKLVKGRDYTLSYSGNVNAGKAKMTVTGKGKYHGKKTVSFEIKKAVNPLKITGKTVSYKQTELSGGSKILAVSKVIKTQQKGSGILRYKKLSGNSKITLDPSTGKVTLKKGLKKGRYRVSVEVRAKGDKNHKSVTKTAVFTVRIT